MDADDIDLVIPPTNADTIEIELQGISDWAAKNNLVLNYAKSHHIVIRRPRFPRDHESIAKVNSIQRVYEMKVLGVTFEWLNYWLLITDTLSISPHVKYLASKSAQISFALPYLSWFVRRCSLGCFSRSHIISRLTYDCPSLVGFLQFEWTRSITGYRLETSQAEMSASQPITSTRRRCNRWPSPLQLDCQQPSPCTISAYSTLKIIWIQPKKAATQSPTPSNSQQLCLIKTS